MRYLVWLVAAGCAAVGDCPDGYVEGAEKGHCDGAAPTFEALVAGMTCDSTTGDGSLDLEAGCLDGACVGDTLADFKAAFGTPTCYTSACLWNSPELFAIVDDANGDGVPDDDERVQSVSVGSFDGKTADGLGLGVSMKCVIDAYPNAGMGVEDGANGWVPTAVLPLGIATVYVTADDTGTVDSLMMMEAL